MQFVKTTRGATQVTLTMEQIFKIALARLEYYHPDRSDPEAFCQNLCCEIEKEMGIYPNVPEARVRASPAGKNNPEGIGVDELANIIRQVDGKHDLGAGALAEKIIEELKLRGVAIESQRKGGGV